MNAFKKILLLIIGVVFIAFFLQIGISVFNQNQGILLTTSDVTSPQLMTRVIISTCNNSQGDFGFAIKNKIDYPVFTCDGEIIYIKYLF